MAHTFISNWNDPFLGLCTENDHLVTSSRCSGVVPQVSIGRGMIRGAGALIAFCVLNPSEVCFGFQKRHTDMGS